jgi:hypothetical protein
MNEQEQADIFKVMNVSDLPDRYFVYNEQKPNFLTPGYLELEPDPLPPLIEECIRNRPSDIYFSPDNNNENENNSCTNDKDDTDMCHNESGYLLSRTDLSSLIQKKLIYQQKILTVPINSSCTNRSSISNLSSSTTTNNNNNNNNILNQISLINNNNNNNKSSKNSPNLLYV